jgi:hypothetical protein
VAAEEVVAAAAVAAGLAAAVAAGLAAAVAAGLAVAAVSLQRLPEVVVRCWATVARWRVAVVPSPVLWLMMAVKPLLLAAVWS